MKSVKSVGCALLLAVIAGCGGDPRVVSRKYVETGNRYFSGGKYKEASLLYRRALQKDARYGEAWYRLGLTNHQLGIYAEARKDFARAMDLDPANMDAMARLADLDLLFYSADQKANKAVLADVRDLAQRLLKKDKQSYDGLRLAGEIALIEKDLARAIQRFEAANQVRPYQRDLVLALAQALLADHQDERAEALARETIEHDKGAGATYDLLYTNYLRTHRLELAEQILQKKIADNPTEGAYAMQLAFHYYRMNRRAEMEEVLERLISKRETFRDARLQAGDFYARIHELDRALAQFELGKKENFRNRRVYEKKIVEVLASQGKSIEAANLLADVLRTDPNDAEAIALRATLRIATGNEKDIKAGIAELEPLARKLAGNAPVHYNLGRAYAAIGKAGWEPARAQFLETLRIDSRHTVARLCLAELDLTRGDHAEALVQAGEVLTAEPANIDARLLRARAWAKMSEYGKAREDLSMVLAADPMSAGAQFELAEIDLKEGHPERAETGFRGLMERGDPRGLYGAVESNARQGRWEQAIQLAQAQVERNPNADSKRRLLAGLLLRAGRYAEAAAEIEALIARNPNAEELYLKLGEAESDIGDASAALAAFQRAREVAPADAAADLDLGILYERMKRTSEARRAYEAALRKQPDNETALNNLAYLEAEQGADLDQALVYAQRARAKKPDDVNVIDTLGLIYIKKNLTEDGLRMLREVVKREPENGAFRLHLALAWYRKGDRQMARKELDIARRKKLTDRDQAEVRELLAKVG
ncbi:MAG TPA: tetratricopeptide repeat protein [Bryobacteraceae bacterium]|nr:tetratricopeptide repeat protein [Bryobacteraceae bacterium]